jgi:hypothetical protein
MNTIEAYDATTRFHNEFEATAKALLEQVREDLIEGAMTCTREEIIAQLIMNNLFPHPCDPEVGDYDGVFKGKLTREQKVMLMGVAEHMGPDYAQALYHAAVFITKVA